MEPEGSSPHLQVSTTCPYPEPDQSSIYNPQHLPPHPQSSFMKIRLVYWFQITARSKKSFILELQKSLFYVCEETGTDVLFPATEWSKMRSIALRVRGALR
jgi:hypothetical protein